jgi:hypothetical protein
MMQDQTGQARDPGSARGEVIADEAEGFPDEQSRPMTRFQKVASALRGDKTERDDPNEAAREQAVHDQPVADQGTPQQVVTASEADTGSDVMTPDADAAPAGSRGSWDAEAEGPGQDGAARTPNAGAAAAGTGASAPLVDEMAPETGPDDVGEQDPSMTRPDTYGSTGTATGAIRTPYRDEGDLADTEAGYGSRAGTAGGYGSQPGTTPGYGSQPGTTPGYGSRTGSGPGYGTEAGTATGYGSRDVTATDPMAPTGIGPAATGVCGGEPVTAARHAAGAAEAGLRPGEATDRLGDFGDIAFGNLLPDADRYAAQWQQIQFRFVDDPQGSVTQAADVVSQVTAQLEAAIQERQRAIQERQRAIQERASALRGRWGEGSNADTETLRETLRMYRAFMDQLIGPTPEQT